MEPVRRIQEHRTVPRPPPKMACNTHHGSKQMRPRPNKSQKTISSQVAIATVGTAASTRCASSARAADAMVLPSIRIPRSASAAYLEAGPATPTISAGGCSGRQVITAKARNPAVTRTPMPSTAFCASTAAVGPTRGYSPHSMRATFITTAVENGATLDDVQRAAGLSQPSTTKLYDRRGYNPEKVGELFATY